MPHHTWRQAVKSADKSLDDARNVDLSNFGHLSPQIHDLRSIVSGALYVWERPHYIP